MSPDTVLTPLSVASISAILVPYLLQFVKRFIPGTVFSSSLDRVMKVLQAVAAVAITVGIRYSFDADTGTLMVTGLTLGSIVMFLIQIAAQYKSFEVVYRAAIKPKADATGRT